MEGMAYSLVVLLVLVLVVCQVFALPAGWQLVAGKAHVDDLHGVSVLTLEPGTRLTFKDLGEVQNVYFACDFSLEAHHPNEEACVVFRDHVEEFQQAYVDLGSQTAAHVSNSSGRWTVRERVSLPHQVLPDDWHHLVLKVYDRDVMLWIDGQQVLHSRDPAPTAGFLGLRIGDGLARFKQLEYSVQQTSLAGKCTLGLDCPLHCWLEWPPVAGEQARFPSGEVKLVSYKRYALAGESLELKFKTTLPHNVQLQVLLRDCEGHTADSITCSAAPEITLQLHPGGACGPQRLVVRAEGTEATLAKIELTAFTRLETPGAPELGDFFELLEQEVKGDEGWYTVAGKRLRLNPTWIRDDIHELKAFKFWSRDLTSPLSFLLEHQAPRGFFYEIFTTEADPHTKFVSPEYVLHFPSEDKALVRLEIEADIEYLMVEGCYQAWQATGDDVWLREALPHLERGLRYSLSDPTRWDPAHGLVKRAFTIDTWDFTWGRPSSNRKIEPDTPMVLMNGDETGTIYACKLLARLYEHVGDSSKADYWRDKAAELRRNLFATLWNGKFFTHALHLGANPLPPDEVPETERLSLSNAYALNRDVCNLAEGRRILETYRKRWETKRDAYFAEWFSVEPPYHFFKMGPHSGYPAGHYINGGLAGFVGGELAKGAFTYGESAYGWDLVQRAIDKVKQDGALYFLYTPEGANQGGGPKGWSAAAFVSALVEGLAGLEDKDCLWREFTLSPRWAATGLEKVTVQAVYGPSRTYCGYTWRLLQDRIELQVACSWARRAHFHVLLPKGKQVEGVLLGGHVAPFEYVTVGPETYVDFDLGGAGPFCSEHITIYFAKH